MKKVRILSIDGGGIRGILPGIVLNILEEKMQEKTKDKNLRLADMFDFFAGTSTGGILTLAYLIPDKNGKAKMTTQDAVDLYLERGDKIFDISLWQKIKSGMGLLDEKYDATELEEALKNNFGDTMLDQLIKPCVITSYDIRDGKPYFFKQHKAKNPIYNFKAKDVARATSAAPTYFEVSYVKNRIGTPYPLIDGGVVANNPALVAYSEARNMQFNGINKPTAKNMMIVSIGTGSKASSYQYDKAKDWGAVSWLKPILEILMSGNSETVDYHLKQIFDAAYGSENNDYYRLEPKVLTADNEMDNASKENMTDLRNDALTFVSNEDIDQELNEIAEKLIEYK